MKYNIVLLGNNRYAVQKLSDEDKLIGFFGKDFYCWSPLPDFMYQYSFFFRRDAEKIYRNVTAIENRKILK